MIGRSVVTRESEYNEKLSSYTRGVGQVLGVWLAQCGRTLSR